MDDQLSPEEANKKPQRPVSNLMPGLEPVPRTTAPPPDPRSKWKTIFILLLIANVLTVILPQLGLLWLSIQASSGVSGTEFLAIPLLLVLLVGFVVIILNIVLVLIYLIKYKPAQPWKAIGIVVVIISVLSLGVVLFGRFIFASSNSSTKFQYSETVTLQRATDLLSACQLKGVSYAEQFGQQNEQNAEKSSTGLVVSGLRSGIPHTLFVSSRMVGQISPLAQQAEQKCPGFVSLTKSGALLRSDGYWSASKP